MSKPSLRAAIGCVGWFCRHCEKNYVVILRSNLRSLLLLHEIATSLRFSQ
ncbi:hypothetical protein [Rickettsia hoogstraalii]|nr:hypothetical protein [Rickettsia hoogstraalii]